MALRISWQAPLSSQPNICSQIKPKPKPKPKPFCALPFKSTITTTTRRKGVQFLIKATEEKDLQSIGSDESVSESESESESVSTQQGPSSGAQPTKNVDSLSELGSEIKKAMRERNERGGGGGEGKDGDFWGGVAEEIKEIEWPAFGKVLRTTGVVIGVIAGSSVVLLTVNAVLAELSDRVFVGRGVQDFFS